MGQNGLLEEVISKGKNHKEGGLSRLRKEREKTQAEITRLKEAEEGFRRCHPGHSLGKGGQPYGNDPDGYRRKKSDGQKARLSQRKASKLEAMECRFLKSLDGETFKRSAKALMDNMQQIPPLELKNW